jgi:hypothetical protein
MSRKHAHFLAVLLLATATWGCSSQMTMMAPMPPQDYEVLGPASGSATWRLFVDGTALNFIPIGLSDRNRAAYQAAVASVPGATGLINVSVQESWNAWYIWSSRTITVTGDAIKETN